MKNVLSKLKYAVGAVLIIIYSTLPLIWAFLISISPEHDMFKADVGFIPDSITWNNYINLLSPGSRQSDIILTLLLRLFQINLTEFL